MVTSKTKIGLGVVYQLAPSPQERHWAANKGRTGVHGAGHTARQMELAVQYL